MIQNIKFFAAFSGNFTPFKFWSPHCHHDFELLVLQIIAFTISDTMEVFDILAKFPQINVAQSFGLQSQPGKHYEKKSFFSLKQLLPIFFFQTIGKSLQFHIEICSESLT